MLDRFILLASLLGVIFQVPASIGDLELIFDQCCTWGVSWGQTRSDCSGYPTPIGGVAAGDQAICQSAVEICCIRTQRAKNCENGKESAKHGRPCAVLTTLGGESHKDCCDGCKMGLVSAGLQMPCTFTNFAFGTPWDEAYYDCCIQTLSNENTNPALPGENDGDQDECKIFPGRLCAHKCINTPGSYHCECFPGFKLHSNGKACVQDIKGNKCEINNPCEQECIDTGVAIQCGCFPGYQLLSDRRSCGDINECELGTDSCNRNTEICQNTLGDFQCIPMNGTESGGRCPSGYYLRPGTQTCNDVDECSAGIDTCDRTSQVCSNTVGSYACISHSENSLQCPPGFKKDAVGTGCIDVNECEENIHGCEEGLEICKNTVGGYKCELDCEEGFVFDEATTECIDINECSEHTSVCKPHELCINTQGSFHCMPDTVAKCPPGFKVEQGTNSQESCIDVDECEENLHSCNLDEHCVNAIGNYRCESVQPLSEGCQHGFKFSEDNNRCVDIDECSEGTHNCSSSDETCVNTNGSFRCSQQNPPNRLPNQCSLGYRFNRSSRKCGDINECLEIKPCIMEQETCVNVPGSYRCQLKCAPGFRFSPKHATCIDVDECAEANHDCNSDKELCINTEGGYRCDSKGFCLPGLKLDKDKTACIDVDECAEGSHNCSLLTHNCVNIPLSFRCDPKGLECRHGFQRNIQTNQCEDVNECAIGAHDCNLDTHYCVNTAGSFQCQTKAQHCGVGFGIDTATHKCIDVDECEEGIQCPPNQDCENTIGSYRCICKEGFEMDPATKICRDVNECQVGLHQCLSSQRCDNTIGSYTCVRTVSCGTGYTLNAETGECEDDDECRIGNHNCGPGFVCRNTMGSFRCDRVTCPPRQKLLSDGTCQVVTCPRGMEADINGVCVDINECVNVGICRPNQRCINTVGSYRCQNLLLCGPGYELNEHGNQCVDIDECARGTQQCGANQICQNRPGGYLCECPVGYAMNAKRECVDIDECVRYRGQVCSVHSECQNTIGSFICNCKSGFRQEEDGRTCVDVDECAETVNLCHHKCINVWGAYQCQCDQGYQLQEDNRSCKDIDECTLWEGRRRLCTGFCINEPGSYSCACPDGYRLSPNKRDCLDINECEQRNACRGENEVCLNTRGGFRCNSIACPPNYIRDPAHRNRCKRATQDCRHDDAECLKQPLSFSYNYMALVSNMQIPLTGQLDLFTMRGPRILYTSVQFNLEMKGSRSSEDVTLATREFFHLRRSAYNEAMISIVRPVPGPQDIELELTMKMYHNGLFGGSAVAKLFIFVTRYEY